MSVQSNSIFFIGLLAFLICAYGAPASPILGQDSAKNFDHAEDSSMPKNDEVNYQLLVSRDMEEFERHGNFKGQSGMGKIPTYILAGYGDSMQSISKPKSFFGKKEEESKNGFLFGGKDDVDALGLIDGMKIFQ